MDIEQDWETRDITRHTYKEQKKQNALDEDCVIVSAAPYSIPFHSVPFPKHKACHLLAWRLDVCTASRL